MAVKFTKVCGSNRPRTKLDFGRVTKKFTKISDPGCCGSGRKEKRNLLAMTGGRLGIL